MGYNTPEYLVSTSITNTVNPLDSTQYYFGSSIGAPNTTSNVKRIYLLTPCTIRKIIIFSQFTAGSNEATTLEIIKNNTSSTTLTSTLDFSATPIKEEYDVNISANDKTDYFEFRLTTPAWVSNPTSVWFYTQIFYTIG